MPSYSTPSPTQSQLPAQPYSRSCSVPADPLAEQASLYGNAFLLEQTSTGRAGTQWAGDPSLLPFYNLLNDPTIEPATRAQTMLEYRNLKLAQADLSTLLSIAAGEDGMPLSLSSETQGTHFPLFERLGQDPAMQRLVLDLSERALSMPPDGVDIQALWDGTRASAELLAGPDATDDASMMALQAMATFMNTQKFDKASKFPVDSATGLPTGLPEGVSPELWQTLSSASRHVANAPSPDAAVMSHGVDAGKVRGDIPFTADNNYHFWTHAWVSASLQAEQGLSAEQAEAISAVAGAQYELRPSSFREEHGNAGLKDILVNAEGAAFGSDLVRDPAAALPGQDQGPPYDVRGLGPLDEMDAATQAVLDQGDITSVEGLLDALLDGVLRGDAQEPSPAGARLPHPLR